MSHHFGIGNLSLEAMVSPASHNKMTHIDSSGKYKEKLLAK